MSFLETEMPPETQASRADLFTAKLMMNGGSIVGFVGILVVLLGSCTSDGTRAAVNWIIGLAVAGVGLGIAFTGKAMMRRIEGF